MTSRRITLRSIAYAIFDQRLFGIRNYDRAIKLTGRIINHWLAETDLGETERPVHHIDVAATAAELLGVKTEGLAGQPAREIL